MGFCLKGGDVTTLAGLGPAPRRFACLFCLSLKQVIGSRCSRLLEPGVAVIGGATKALSRLHSWSVGLEFWIGRWCLDRNWICGYSLDLDCRRRRLLYITI